MDLIGRRLVATADMQLEIPVRNRECIRGIQRASTHEQIGFFSVAVKYANEIAVDQRSILRAVAAGFITILRSGVKADNAVVRLVTVNPLQRASALKVDEVIGRHRRSGTWRDTRHVAALVDLNGRTVKMKVLNTVNMVPVATVSRR